MPALQRVVCFVEADSGAAPAAPQPTGEHMPGMHGETGARHPQPRRLAEQWMARHEVVPPSRR